MTGIRVRRNVGLLVAALLGAHQVAAAQAPELTVESIWGGNTFASDLVSLQWSADPRFYTTVVEGEAAGLYRVNARTGERELIVAQAALVPPGGAEPIVIEQYAFSNDGAKLLIFTNSVRVWRDNTKGEYFVWDFARRRLTPVSTQPGYQMFAKFSPDGRLVGFVRDHNIFVTDLATGEERQLTHDGSDDVINGTTDWVYEEELGLRDAFRFSPDSRRIAFWRLDQSAIPPFFLLDELELYPALVPVRYPKAGTANSTVQLGVVEVTGGAPRWIDVGPVADIYIPAMDFLSSPDSIWFTRLNRHQNRLELLVASVTTGGAQVIWTDVDEAWVDAEAPIWVGRGDRFIAPSERGGFRQLWLFDRAGRVVRALTPDGWDVTDTYGVDQRRGAVYFAGAGEGPTERHVYRVGLDGRGLTRLTRGAGWHSASFNADFSLFVDTYSTAAVPPAQTLRSADGRAVRVLAANADLRAKVEALDLAAPEFMTVPAADGTPLNAYVIRPRDFDETRRYPLVLYVYGGPGSQTATNAWGGQRYLWHQMLAEAGFLVATVDNRGTGARGRAFKKVTYQRLGQVESDDQIAAARYFASLPYVDGARIAIWGWSYGGYMTLQSLFRGEGAFAAGIAVAPVTDWRFYDTIYTERYMRTPRENPDGYEQGAPVNHVDKLRGRLLVVHGTGDDNVHSQNTMQLVHALEEANKQFDMRLYPNKTHSIAGRTTRVNLYGLMTQWLKENL